MTDLNNILAGGAIPPEARVVDQPRIEAAVREILLSVGENPDRDGLKETPARVARMYAEIFGGLHVAWSAFAKSVRRTVRRNGAGSRHFIQQHV